MIKVDYSYIETFLNVFDGLDKLDSLKSTNVYRTVLDHARATGNDFGFETLKKLFNSREDNSYGFQDIFENIDSIREFYETLRSTESLWLAEIERYILKLFSNKHINATICPSVGYDIGIGLNKQVCINLNNKMLLNDFNEFISIVIHETVHTCFEEIHGSVFELIQKDGKTDLAGLLDYMIHSEGIAIFAAEEFRTINNLPMKGNAIQEDYNDTPERRKELKDRYKEIVINIKNGMIKDIEDFFDKQPKTRCHIDLGIVSIISLIKKME